LPERPRWSEGADEILVEKGGERVRIYKKDNRWFVGDEGFPADAKVAEKMEEKIRDLVISDISSYAPHYDRFELTPAGAIHVVVKRGGEVLRDVYFGKRSDKTNHTYIRLAGRDEVFKASGTFSYEFSKKVDDIRDKAMIDVKSDDIESLEILYKGKRTALSRVKNEQVQDAAKTEADKNKSEKAKAKKAQDTWIFAGNNQNQVDVAAVNAVINSFAPLRANSFPAIDRNALKNPLCSVKIISGGKAHELAIFKGTSESEFIGTSSDSPYVFTLQKFNAERYFREPKDFEKRP
jgi:hypothetical protein